MADKFYSGIKIVELATDPPTPPSGEQIIYTKGDGKVYNINSSGTITELTNVAGGGGGLSFQEVMRVKIILNNL